MLLLILQHGRKEGKGKEVKIEKSGLHDSFCVNQTLAPVCAKQMGVAGEREGRKTWGVDRAGRMGDGGGGRAQRVGSSLS